MLSTEEVEFGPIPLNEIKDLCTAEQDPATEGFQIVRTTYRIKDPKRSIKFYNTLGMTLLNGLDIPELKVSIYYMGYADKIENELLANKTQQERDVLAMTRSSTLGLSYEWGTEYDPAFNYNLGTGYSNISILVPDVREATERLQKFGAVFSTSPDESKWTGMAFCVDPDGYIVQMYDNKTLHDLSIARTIQNDQTIV